MMMVMMMMSLLVDLFFMLSPRQSGGHSRKTRNEVVTVAAERQPTRPTEKQRLALHISRRARSQGRRASGTAGAPERSCCPPPHIDNGGCPRGTASRGNCASSSQTSRCAGRLLRARFPSTSCRPPRHSTRRSSNRGGGSACRTRRGARGPPASGSLRRPLATGTCGGRSIPQADKARRITVRVFGQGGVNAPSRRGQDNHGACFRTRRRERSKPTRPGESRFVFSDKEARTLQADAARQITVRVFGQGGENDS